MAAFLFFTLYCQNTKSSLKSCQIFLGVLAWKPFGIMGHYFGFWACHLTNFPHFPQSGLESDWVEGITVQYSFYLNIE